MVPCVCFQLSANVKLFGDIEYSYDVKCEAKAARVFNSRRRSKTNLTLTVLIELSNVFEPNIRFKM